MTNNQHHAKALWWAIRVGIGVAALAAALMFVPKATAVLLPVLLLAFVGGGATFLTYTICRMYYEDHP